MCGRDVIEIFKNTPIGVKIGTKNKLDVGNSKMASSRGGVHPGEREGTDVIENCKMVQYG